MDHGGIAIGTVLAGRTGGCSEALIGAAPPRSRRPSRLQSRTRLHRSRRMMSSELN